LAGTRQAQGAQSSLRNKAVRLNKSFKWTREPHRDAFRRWCDWRTRYHTNFCLHVNSL